MIDYEKGDIVIIELKAGEIYDGILISKSAERISICSTVEYPSGKLFENICNFSIKEINTSRILSDKKDNGNNKVVNKINLNIQEYKHLTNLINSFKLIKQMDVRFYDAVQEIETAESIGIDAKGCQIGRFYKISYLIISVWNQVFVFDMVNLDQMAFNSGLQLIFENEFILKVCHNSQKLNDCLLHNYGVKMKNVFDVLLADFTLQERHKEKDPRHRSIEDLIIEYLNLPSCFVDKITDEEWTKRPLPITYQEMIATRCSFLLFLKNILQKKMNESLNKITDMFYCMATDTLNPTVEETILPKRLLQML
ncbi:piRNA biogenesis protein EXD1-like [Chrysoperla carnea]|uniref:piRNA biogenesis protein EXD1-like n=1 Tax=Chrysoperla carnea TaxID=189513 RepID=UPI001D07D809|nr:piRNA biogenesis protein EXD1-like [Chrysoperla carnea]